MPTKQHILVTGGCGFIGSHLTRTLCAQGHHVTVLDNLSSGKRESLPAEAHFILGDIRDPAAVTQAMQNTNACFHLAAIASVTQSTEDWAGTHSTNLTGAIRIFEQAAKQSIPVIYASSAAIYGDAPQIPLAETTPAHPITAYGADKYGCELHAQAGAHTHGLRSAGLRFFNVYGPGQDPTSPYSGVISKFIEAMEQNTGLTIFGDGQQTRDFIFVADIVTDLLAAHQWLQNPNNSGQIVTNACTGKQTSILELAHILSSLYQRPPTITHAPARTGDIRISCGNPTLREQLWGQTNRTPIESGLRQTLTDMGASHVR